MIGMVNSAHTAELETLFQKVVKQINKSVRQPTRHTDNGAEVVYQAEIDDARYMLVRQPLPVQADSTEQLSLSPREQEIVRLVAKGLSNKAVAAVLEISPWTVATHLRRIFSKLEVGSRAEMVAQVLQAGLLQPEDE